MQLDEILRYDDIMKISEFMSENGFNKNITIVNEVENSKILNRINEDFFYRLRDSGDTESEPVTSDEVQLNVNGINFLYKVKEND